MQPKNIHNVTLLLLLVEQNTQYVCVMFKKNGDGFIKYNSAVTTLQLLLQLRSKCYK